MYGAKHLEGAALDLAVQEAEPLCISRLSVNTAISNELGEKEPLDGAVSRVFANQVCEGVAGGVLLAELADDVGEAERPRVVELWDGKLYKVDQCVKGSRGYLAGFEVVQGLAKEALDQLWVRVGSEPDEHVLAVVKKINALRFDHLGG